MRWFAPVWTLLLLLLWLPSTSHSLLEQVGLIDEWHADHDHGSSGSHRHHSTEHDVAHGIVLAPTAKVRVPTPELLAPPAYTQLAVLASDLTIDTPSHMLARALPGAAPPSRIRPWQFAHRAALPIRAPSSPA